MGLIYGISNVSDGNMSYLWGGGEEVLGNRVNFLDKFGLKIGDCVFTSLNHGDEIAEVGFDDKNKTVECDAVITKEKGVVLFMLTADCFPVIVYDDQKLALVHLGRKGVELGLIKKAMPYFGSGVEVIMGPGIRKESYIFDGVAIDLPGQIKNQLGNVKIRDCGIDTGKDVNYFSHRRSVTLGELEGRFATIALMN